jgi:integrase
VIHLRNPSYIYKNRLGVYCFQRRVPEAFRSSNVASYVRFSLRTKNLQTALISVRKICLMYDELAKNYFDTEYGYLQGKKLLERYRDLSNQGASLAVFEEDLFADLETSKDEVFFRKALSYAKDIAISRNDYSLLPEYLKPQKNSSETINSELDENFEMLFSYLDKVNHNVLNQSTAHLIPKLLSEAIEDFTSQKKLTWSKDGGSQEKYNAIFKLFLDLTGNIKTTELTKEHANKFLKLILNYPANKNKDSKYRSYSTEEIITAQVDEKDKLSHRTKSVYIGHISSFLNFISRNGWALADINFPLVGVIPKKIQQSVDDRDPFTEHDLRSLFNSKHYIECRHNEAFKYWAPLIGLLSGARQNEICQLFLNDIIFNEETKIWLFDINENDPEVSFKSLKRPHHKRKVPIHKTLINLGFLDYVEHLKKKGEKRLFPELPYNGGRNKYATRMTKWFNSTYTNKVNCNITTPNTCYHSLRHNVINYFAHKIGLNSTMFAYVVGQTPVGNVSDKTYIKAAEIIQLADWYSKLDFSYCIDFKKIPNWKRFPFAR